MSSRILLGVSGGPKNQSKIELAFNLAKQSDCALSALAIKDVERLKQTDSASLGVYSHQARKIEERLHRADEHLAKRLDDFDALAAENGVRFSPLSVHGDALHAITEAWSFHDLLILDTHPWPIGVDAPEDSTILLKLIAHGISPMLAVPKGAPTRVRKCLVGLSGSLESAKALKHLVMSGVFSEAAIHVVTVGAPKSNDTAEELLEKATAYCEIHGHEATSSILEGASSETILREIEAVNADLVAIGSSFRRFLFREKFGTHAKAIIDRSPVAVFISH
ncbi:MAG: universal stress protein [Hyphomicrobiales bacterium]